MSDYRMSAFWYKGGRGGNQTCSFQGTCAESLVFRMKERKNAIKDSGLLFSYASSYGDRQTPDGEIVAEANELMGGLLQVEITDEDCLWFTGPGIANTPLTHAAVVFCRDGFDYQRAILGLLPGLFEKIDFDHEKLYPFESHPNWGWGSQRFLAYSVDPRLWAEALKENLVSMDQYGTYGLPLESATTVFMLAELGYTSSINKRYCEHLRAKTIKFTPTAGSPANIKSGCYRAYGIPSEPRNMSRLLPFTLDFREDWFNGDTLLPPDDIYTTFRWYFSPEE